MRGSLGENRNRLERGRGHEVPVRCPTGRSDKTRSDRSGANPGRSPEPPLSDLGDLSVLGRFNSLIVDFISLFFGFISRFGRLENWHSGARDINVLPAQLRSLPARNRGFCRIFPSTREPDPNRLTRPPRP
jgi:hypothetical protein